MEEILHRAEQLEKDYDWLGAAEPYENYFVFYAIVFQAYMYSKEARKKQALNPKSDF